jgi:hypothetical protein
LKIIWWIWKDIHRIYRPAIYSLFAGLGMLAIMPFMPLRPLSIPVIIGGGLSFGILISGGLYGKSSRQSY